MDAKIKPESWPRAHQLAWINSNHRALYVMRCSDGRNVTMTRPAAIAAINAGVAKLVITA
jgi:hypothetical protein